MKYVAKQHYIYDNKVETRSQHTKKAVFKNGNQLDLAVL